MNKQEKGQSIKKSKKKKQESDILLDKKKKGLRNRETNIISFVFIGLFGLMMGYLVYFNVVEAPAIVNSPYNKRIDNQETKVTRGSKVRN
jgi:peptidoglycan glycosyltransferase